MAPNTQAMDHDALRRSYAHAVSDKQLCETLIATLQATPQDNVGLAYLGALQTIWANHVFSPIAKWRTFNEGRSKIEKAVRNDPSNPEIRAIRLSVQKNAPRFLGYYEQIDEDEKFTRGLTPGQSLTPGPSPKERGDSRETHLENRIKS